MLKDQAWRDSKLCQWCRIGCWAGFGLFLMSSRLQANGFRVMFSQGVHGRSLWSVRQPVAQRLGLTDGSQYLARL